jgi:nitronate monooxygenase
VQAGQEPSLPAADPPRDRLGDLRAQLALPLICAPMFLVSGPELVIAACRHGVIGSFPAPNARPLEVLDAWMARIAGELAAVRQAEPERRVAPWSLNLVVHSSYDRLPAELELVQRHRPPLLITALGSPARVVDAVHAYGGLVLADVGSVAMARKAVQAGVDGLVLVSTGAGGHTGSVAPFVFVQAVRQFFDGIVVLAGGLCNGAAIRAAELAGADLADIGTLFIAARESLAPDDYRAMVVEAGVDDLVLTRAFTGANAYYLRRSVERAGLDPDHLAGKTAMDWKNSEQQLKAWKDIWSAGQSVSAVARVEGAGEIIARLRAEYAQSLNLPAFGA